MTSVYLPGSPFTRNDYQPCGPFEESVYLPGSRFTLPPYLFSSDTAC